MNPTSSQTSQSTSIPMGTTLVSKTDLRGHITYANAAFVSTHGHPVEALLGSTHRIVRHPDMPAALFADMWKSLQSGKPWQGLLKNRCHNGDAYWAHACIVPIRRHEKVEGYMSVLTGAEAAAIETAEHAYRHAAPNEKLPTHQPTAFFGVRAGIRAGNAFVAALILAGGLLGIGGLTLSDAAFSRLYHEQFEPVTAVGQVEAQLSAIRVHLLETQLDHSGTASSQTVETLRNAFDEIHEIFSGVSASAQGTTSASAALAQSLQQYTAEGRTLLNQAVHDAPSGLTPPVQQQLLGLEGKASLTAHALRQSLADAAQQEFVDTLQRNQRIRTLAIAGIVLGLLAIAVVGHRFIGSIVNPLNDSIRRLNRIAEGDLQGHMPLSGTGETAQLNQAAVVMQQHLHVMLDEIALAARRIQQHCQALNQSLHEVTEHSEAQHDQVHAATRALETAVSETSDLSQRAERLMYMAAGVDHGGDVTTTVEHEARELATATRLTAFGAEEVASAMRQVAHLIVENRSEAQLAWQASEQLMHTARELNQLVDFFAPRTHAPT